MTWAHYHESDRWIERATMTKPSHVELSDVLEQAASALTSDGARELIQRAYAVAEKAHSGQNRASGESYIRHPLAVARLLAEVGMDAGTIAAGFLHDVVEESGVSLERIEKDFGHEIVVLVDGVTKLEQIDQFSRKGEAQRDEQESESLRKMFLAMADDVRVVMIKLADRLHNMRTLRGLKPERQKSFARETLDIFAPLANRLGLWQWKWQLEDLSLRHLDPKAYAEIADLIEEKRVEREAAIDNYIEMLSRRLALEGIEADITGRPKHIYSIHHKMHRKGVPFSKVHDVRGIRVIAGDVSDCYRVLGIVHSLWNPIPGEFDDYIATPKANLYQSLHTAVVAGDGKTLEVQIRTWDMHRNAEYGVAAHWRYKEGGKRDEDLESRMAWLRSLLELRKDAPDAQEFVDAMKTDVFQDRVYAFTPKGKLIDLPAGATPVDFAYHVHTEIGHRCRGARVNGRLVGLGYQLRNGDQDEILTARRSGPSRDWLNPAVGYVHTSRARSKIRQWFRRQDRDVNIAQGREVVERELKRLGLEHLGHERVAHLLDFEKLDNFHAAVGFGDINSQQIAGRIAETRPRGEEKLPFTPPPAPSIKGIQVQGTGGLLTRLGLCCNALPGDDIIGYVTRGRGVTVHRRDCSSVLRQPDTERLIEVSWGQRSQTVPATIYITAYDRTKLLSQISTLIGEEDINIASVRQ
ncbi:MAG: bifunctional (p)ppGpp synthetase/guanosine-3',5'-bis(diphosphate) 3'-pyrophosphohydrolase, partial [Anaerolineales bacterium]